MTGESWPRCQNCTQPLQLFLQLDFAALAFAKDVPHKSGVFQLFYCTGSEPLCEVDCQAFFPFSKSTLLRVIPISNVESMERPPGSAFPPRRVVRWDEVEDYPNSEELYDLGIELPEPELDLLMEHYPVSGDKLGGWPMWIQGVEYPNCPECDEAMRLLFQIDSEKNLPYMFGDVGCGHVTYCPNHPSVCAFGWACS